ncbi:hypothetical protein U7230_11195 [Carboxydochorda subterranea]|uniref:Uncharacterized protein n=1 Tax=Carboxydichorda subterranea TaxID=3109565 RepID=A0ABZ1BVT5_9FIRM|nr:hypothetical protein [Limnochorda sp. L945t]WRP16651.1 hypothetical protein U7230_11195 [Limnochorda sp. L945t]
MTFCVRALRLRGFGPLDDVRLALEAGLNVVACGSARTAHAIAEGVASALAGPVPVPGARRLLSGGPAPAALLLVESGSWCYQVYRELSRGTVALRRRPRVPDPPVQWLDFPPWPPRARPRMGDDGWEWVFAGHEGTGRRAGSSRPAQLAERYLGVRVPEAWWRLMATLSSREGGDVRPPASVLRALQEWAGRHGLLEAAARLSDRLKELETRQYQLSRRLAAIEERLRLVREQESVEAALREQLAADEAATPPLPEVDWSPWKADPEAAVERLLQESRRLMEGYRRLAALEAAVRRLAETLTGRFAAFEALGLSEQHLAAQWGELRERLLRRREALLARRQPAELRMARYVEQLRQAQERYRQVLELQRAWRLMDLGQVAGRLAEHLQRARRRSGLVRELAEQELSCARLVRRIRWISTAWAGLLSFSGGLALAGAATLAGLGPAGWTGPPALLAPVAPLALAGVAWTKRRALQRRLRRDRVHARSLRQEIQELEDAARTLLPALDEQALSTLYDEARAGLATFERLEGERAALESEGITAGHLDALRQELQAVDEELAVLRGRLAPVLESMDDEEVPRAYRRWRACRDRLQRLEPVLEEQRRRLVVADELVEWVLAAAPLSPVPLSVQQAQDPASLARWLETAGPRFWDAARRSARRWRLRRQALQQATALREPGSPVWSVAGAMEEAAFLRDRLAGLRRETEAHRLAVDWLQRAAGGLSRSVRSMVADEIRRIEERFPPAWRDTASCRRLAAALAVGLVAVRLAPRGATWLPLVLVEPESTPEEVHRVAVEQAGQLAMLSSPAGACVQVLLLHAGQPGEGDPAFPAQAVQAS